jgi:hypothetical protein
MNPTEAVNAVADKANSLLDTAADSTTDLLNNSLPEPSVSDLASDPESEAPTAEQRRLKRTLLYRE